jgi:hypothetical protein
VPTVVSPWISERATRECRTTPPVAGVDHVHVGAASAIQMRGDQMRRPGLRVTHDEHVGVHRDQVVDRVEQRLALGRGGNADVQVDHVGGQALRRDLERRSRARRVFEEQVENRLAAQQRNLLHLALGDRSERHRGVENPTDHVRRQTFERQQMDQVAGGVELRVTHPVVPPLHRRRLLRCRVAASP